jgi:hypothetical protein
MQTHMSAHIAVHTDTPEQMEAGDALLESTIG